MPIPLLLAAAPAIAQTASGLAQMAFSGRKKALKNLEEQTNANPSYSGNRSINDYYNKALSRYNENPYQSQQYQVAAKNAQRGAAMGLGALQDRRSGLAGVSRMVGIQNQALENAGVNAEQQRNLRFSQLGGATSQKASDDLRMFQTNVMSPYERRLQLANMKAQGAANTFNAGMSNLFGGLSNASTLLGGVKGGEQSLSGQSASTFRTPEQTISTPRNLGMPQAPMTLTRKAMDIKPISRFIGI